MTSLLVIRFSSMGDIILTSPLLQELRKQYPAAQIDLLTKGEYSELGHALGYDRVHLLPSGGGLTELVQLGVKLRNEQFSYVLDAHHNLRSHLIRLALRAKSSVVNKRRRERNLLVKKKINTLGNGPDVVGRYIETGKSLGLSDSGLLPELHLGPRPIRNPERIALCPGAKHWNKEWPTERFAEVARELSKAGLSIVILGGEDAKAAAHEIISATPTAVSYCGSLSILQTARELASCSIAITNDSGLMHLANAVGTPTVSIFGATVPEFGFAPRNPESEIVEVKGLYCRPCTTQGLDHCPEKHFRCMLEITPEMLIDSVKIHIPSSAD